MNLNNGNKMKEKLFNARLYLKTDYKLHTKQEDKCAFICLRMHWVTIKQAFLVFHVIMGITRIAADAVYLVKLWDKFMRSSERLHQSAKGQRWVLTHIWLSKQSLSEGSGNLFVVFISAQYSYTMYTVQRKHLI